MVLLSGLYWNNGRHPVWPLKSRRAAQVHNSARLCLFKKQFGLRISFFFSIGSCQANTVTSVKSVQD